jgi:hypothetical protein
MPQSALLRRQIRAECASVFRGRRNEKGEEVLSAASDAGLRLSHKTSSALQGGMRFRRVR